MVTHEFHLLLKSHILMSLWKHWEVRGALQMASQPFADSWYFRFAGRKTDHRSINSWGDVIEARGLCLQCPLFLPLFSEMLV